MAETTRPTLVRLPTRPRSTLTASAARVKPSGRESAYIIRSGLPWQNWALALYDQVPELHFAAQFYARMLQKVQIYPALVEGDPDNPVKLNSGEPFDTLQQIQDAGGGRSKILSSYGRLMFVTGEGYLFGRNIGDGAGDWSFVWKDELRFDDSGNVTHILAPGFPPVEYRQIPDSAYEPVDPGTAVAYRIWTPHPRFSGWPDSPMRGVLEIGEELLALTKTVHATATSRLTQGIFLLPTEVSPPVAEPIGDEDPENNPFIDRLVDLWSAQIENPSQAAALAPILLEGSYEYLDRIRMLKMHDPQTDYVERDLRKEAIERLSYGLDLPPEALTGFGGVNHWSAYAIMDMIWNDHGVPMTQQFCNDINEVFLRPSLREQGFADWERIVIGYDATSVVVNPDRSDDANEAWDRGAISYAAYRRLKNIPETDAQPADEHAEWLETKIVRVRETDQGLAPGGLPKQAQEAKPIPGQGAPPGGPAAVQQGRVASAEMGAAQLAVLRCRELAGSRIRRDEKRCPDCLKAADGKPNALVAALVGPEAMDRLGSGEPRELVRGGASSFGMLLEGWGYSPVQVTALCEMVEVFAARSLFEPVLPVLPASFAAHLERTREM